MNDRKAQSLTQPTTITPQDLLEKYREVARAQKRAEAANRDAAQVAAQARDMILEFCVAAGVKIEVDGDD